MGAVLAGQYDTDRPPFLIDFGIRSRSIPRVSFIDVLNGDEATLGPAAKQEGRHRRHRARARRSLQRSQWRHRRPARCCRRWRRNRSCRAARCTGRPTTTTLIGLALLALAMVLAWRRLSAGRAARRARRNGGRDRSPGLSAAGGISAHPRHVAVPYRDRGLCRGHRTRRDRSSRPARPGCGEPLPAHRDVARRRPDLHRCELPDHGVESRAPPRSSATSPRR